MTATRTLRLIGLGLGLGIVLLTATACAHKQAEATAAPGLKAGRDCAAGPDHPDKDKDKDKAAAFPKEWCANQANLAAMIADPEDLKKGKAFGGADGARQALIVDAYQRKEDKPAAAAATGGATLMLGPTTSMPHPGGS
jgi:hypothetical protein